MAIAFTLQTAFAKIIPCFAEDEGWHAIFEEEDCAGFKCSVSFKRMDGGSMLGRFQYTIKSPVEDILKFMPRPESLAAVPEPQFWDMKLAEVLSPGDALLEVKMNRSESAGTWNAMVRLNDACFNHRLEPRDKDADVGPWEDHIERMVVRRGFPGPDQVTFVSGPLDPDTGKLINQLGSVEAGFGIYNFLPDDKSRVLVTHGTFVPGESVPHWMAPHGQQLLAMERSILDVFLGSGEAALARELDTTMYLVLSLRGLARGPPLLPATREEYEAADAQSRVDLPGNEFRFWIRASREECHLVPYLRGLFSRCSISDLAVFNLLDGRELLHYQVAVPSKAWHSASARVDEILSEHRAAYRRLNGGKSAPQLVETTARFREESCVDTPCPDSEETPGSSPLVVRNTFLELAEPDEDAPQPERLRRSNSS